MEEETQEAFEKRKEDMKRNHYILNDSFTTCEEVVVPTIAENILTEEKQKVDIKEIYFNLKEVLKNYIDTKEENYEILALWIIGTWMHDKFYTYPYLFMNAMKGSGKTRLLKLIKELSWEGDMAAAMSEAVLFRTTGTLCIDEFENVASRDANALREVLNTAYKKGGKVKRMRKKKTIDGEKQIVEEFSTFRPICLANIFGMEEVLGDRCITILLEKSGNSNITRKIECFDIDPTIQNIKNQLKQLFSVGLCSVGLSENIYIDWNTYLNACCIKDTLPYTHTHPTLPNTTIHKLFEKLFNTGIDGRNLELTLPLLLIAEEVGILDEAITILKSTVEERRAEDIMESKDLMVFDFVAQQLPGVYVGIKELTNRFRVFISYDEEEKWLNSTWFGLSLKRLNLISSKKRIGKGMEVMLNTNKASDKLKLFKDNK